MYFHSLIMDQILNILENDNDPNVKVLHARKLKKESTFKNKTSNVTWYSHEKNVNSVSIFPEADYIQGIEI